MRNILFISSILASVTHEMQNVMAIIKESGALTDDILSLNKMTNLRHGDKLTSALTNIQEQVGRGRNLMLMLNGFAHAAADYPTESDLRRFARQIGVLAERMVRLKECALHTDLDGQPLFVSVNALLLMQSVYLGLAAVLEGCEPKDSLRLDIVQQEQAVGAPFAASLRISAAQSKKVPDTTALAPVMAECGGVCDAYEGSLNLNYPAATNREQGPAI